MLNFSERGKSMENVRRSRTGRIGSALRSLYLATAIGSFASGFLLHLYFRINFQGYLADTAVGAASVGFGLFALGRIGLAENSGSKVEPYFYLWFLSFGLGWMAWNL